MREATWDVIKGQGVKRQGEVFWILHVHMDMGGDSAFWESAATRVILPSEHLCDVYICPERSDMRIISRA